MSADSVAQDQIKALVDRIIRLREEERAIKGDVREVYAEAKANGLDKTILGKIVNYVEKRETSAGALQESEALFDLYLTAYDAAGTKNANAHTHEADLTYLVPAHDPITGEIADETPMSNASGQPGGVDPERKDDAASAGETAPIRRMSMTPLEPREAGGLKGFGFTVRFDEPEAAMLPQTAGSETAVANSTPGSGAGTVDAGEANWPSEMTTASPANEPETIPPAADPTVVVSEAGGGDSALSLAAIPVADQSKPNPICRDPGDCGVYASWAMPCQACKAAAAHRSAA